MGKKLEPTIIRMIVIRMLLGLSQSDLASIIGYSASYVQKVESGDKKLSRDYLRAFCRELNVSESYILHAEIKPFI